MRKAAQGYEKANLDEPDESGSRIRDTALAYASEGPANMSERSGEGSRGKARSGGGIRDKARFASEGAARQESEGSETETREKAPADASEGASTWTMGFARKIRGKTRFASKETVHESEGFGARIRDVVRAYASDGSDRRSARSASASKESASRSDRSAYASKESAYSSERSVYASKESAYRSDRSAYASKESAYSKRSDGDRRKGSRASADASESEDSDGDGKRGSIASAYASERSAYRSEGSDGDRRKGSRASAYASERSVYRSEGSDGDRRKGSRASAYASESSAYRSEGSDGDRRSRSRTSSEAYRSEASAYSSETSRYDDDDDDDGLAFRAVSTLKDRLTVGMWVRIFVLILAALGLVGIAYRFASLVPHFSQRYKVDALNAGRVCLTHVAFGEEFQAINNLTIPAKRKYADRWGYDLKVYVKDSFEDLIANDFSNCADGELVEHSQYDRQSLLKFCGIWAAFADSCDTVLFTDGDAVVANERMRVEEWLEKDVKADVYWSLNDVTKHSYCGTPMYGQIRGAGTLELAMFGTCLNSGAFIMRKNDWTKQYLKRLLVLSTKSIERKCSTKTLNPDQFDQCDFRVWGRETTPGQDIDQTKVGDQCIIACEAMENTDSMKHFVFFGPQERPVFQFVQISPSGIYKAVNWRPWVQEGAFVVNCAGHMLQDQKINCVKLHAAEVMEDTA